MKNEKKAQNTRFKVTINCEDCGSERIITKACLNLVKRCKSCQKIFNRDRARNRYRELKGIPMDKPIIGRQKKETKEVKPQKPANVNWGPKETVKVEQPLLSEAEIARRKAVMEKLFEQVEDKSTTDDW